MKYKDLNKLIAFAVLMENGKGILSKAPDYVLEKYNYINSCSSSRELTSGMDPINKNKYYEYRKRWISIIEEE